MCWQIQHALSTGSFLTFWRWHRLQKLELGGSLTMNLQQSLSSRTESKRSEHPLNFLALKINGSLKWALNWLQLVEATRRHKFLKLFCILLQFCHSQLLNITVGGMLYLYPSHTMISIPLLLNICITPHEYHFSTATHNTREPKNAPTDYVSHQLFTQRGKHRNSHPNTRWSKKVHLILKWEVWALKSS